MVDAAHVGDIVGAFGRIRRDATGMGRSRWQRLRALLVIIGRD
ncbi:putative transmembrane protein [Mycobacterium xenopi 4042]|uniref:Putative transmembrane protein n=1 Tax=Mycobacterium xenopi 4042 TaxID=1299334 RepID=X8BHE8_MYCXE|nr:putative transmembrane protein [Mycobacterium xenopi 4042]